ncbi:MAG: hypothetical protein IKW33_04400 [Clostridia bacterium]|nr:hypothetical protein [Clostridia bacterium]
MKNLFNKLFNRQKENACLTLLTNKRYKKCIELVRKPKRRTSLSHFFENLYSLRENRLSLRHRTTFLYSQQELYK